MMNATKQCIRQFLADRKIEHTEREYPHYSIFAITKSEPRLEIDLLGFEEESMEPGDVFVNQPFYDPFFNAQGAARIGKANIASPDFQTTLESLLRGERQQGWWSR